MVSVQSVEDLVDWIEVDCGMVSVLTEGVGVVAECESRKRETLNYTFIRHRLKHRKIYY